MLLGYTGWFCKEKLVKSKHSKQDISTQEKLLVLGYNLIISTQSFNCKSTGFGSEPLNGLNSFHTLQTHLPRISADSSWNELLISVAEASEVSYPRLLKTRSLSCHVS
jgi:hypothetical protein